MKLSFCCSSWPDLHLSDKTVSRETQIVSFIPGENPGGVTLVSNIQVCDKLKEKSRTFDP